MERKARGAFEILTSSQDCLTAQWDAQFNCQFLFHWKAKTSVPLPPISAPSTVTQTSLMGSTTASIKRSSDLLLFSYVFKILSSDPNHLPLMFVASSPNCSALEDPQMLIYIPVHPVHLRGHNQQILKQVLLHSQHWKTGKCPMPFYCWSSAQTKLEMMPLEEHWS